MSRRPVRKARDGTVPGGKVDDAQIADIFVPFVKLVPQGRIRTARHGVGEGAQILVCVDPPLTDAPGVGLLFPDPCALDDSNRRLEAPDDFGCDMSLAFYGGCAHVAGKSCCVEGAQNQWDRSSLYGTTSGVSPRYTARIRSRRFIVQPRVTGGHTGQYSAVARSAQGTCACGSAARLRYIVVLPPLEEPLTRSTIPCSFANSATRASSSPS